MVKKQSKKEPLERRVLHFIRDNHLVSSGQKLLVAVSGGPDSVCMLDILIKLRGELGIGLHIAHLNHKLRGSESDDDAKYVDRLARTLDIPVSSEARDVLQYKELKRTTLEEAAREVRYSFFSEVAESVGADCVAVGHTSDDNVETVLLHLIRGAGTRGLRGLQPVSSWKYSGKSLSIIRPLLEINRRETKDYCRTNGLEPRIDSSNQSLSPLRNRVRMQLLPILESYNPQVAESLLRTARIAGDDLAALDAEIIRLQENIIERQGETIIFKKENFLGMAPAWQRQMLRRSIEELRGSLKDIEVRHIDEIMDALDKAVGKSLDLPSGLVFAVEYDRYLLTRDTAEISPYPVIEGEGGIKIPGETLFSGWSIKAEILEHANTTADIGIIDACFDAEKVGDTLTVRSRRRGDRFYPLGIAGQKKLGEFMIDSKIPRAWRDRVPVVCSPEQVLWVVGYRIDDRVKVTDGTKKILCLEFIRV